MYFNSAKAFAQKYRSEISPIMNKMGFKVSVTTYKEYYDEGKVIVKIKKFTSLPIKFKNIKGIFANGTNIAPAIIFLTNPNLCRVNPAKSPPSIVIHIP